MRVVETDNFGGDYPNERFVGEVMTQEEAKAYAKTLNVDPFASRYFKVVSDDYKLEPGFEP